MPLSFIAEAPELDDVVALLEGIETEDPFWSLSRPNWNAVPWNFRSPAKEDVRSRYESTGMIENNGDQLPGREEGGFIVGDLSLMCIYPPEGSGASGCCAASR